MITSKARIAEHLGMSTQNLGKTYFNGDPKKEKMGEALDRGTYLAENNIRDDELVFMVQFIKQHKEVIIKRVFSS
ncbi:MAG TPA: hypothetical protein ENK66_03355 [Arcobacter sp.]|nr:hypothetical protein [Arcobacter sp.]